MSFNGKVVLITGASSGIGAGSAIYFARNGAHLALTGRNAENLEKTKTECEKVSLKTTKILLIQADVTTDAEKIINNTIEKFNQLDVLVNNAGVFSWSHTIKNANLSDYDWIMNTNVRAVYKLTSLAIPHLIKTKGNIVNVSSVAGFRCVRDALPYCMSKAALDQFTRCIALELGPEQVRCNSVNPAVIVTDIFNRAGMDEKAINELLEYCNKSYPLRRPGTVEDTAEAIGFLADNQRANFITGVLFPVDGAKSVEMSH